MKVHPAIVFIVIGVAVAAAFWFVWMNRASEKIVTATLPIAIAALVGIFLAGWVFAGDDDYQVTFPVCFLVDLRTKFEIETPDIFRAYRFSVGRSPVPELKIRRPDLFPEDRNYFARNIYQHLLQRSFIDFLVLLYRGSWKARTLRFDIGSITFGQFGPATEEQPISARVLKTNDIERALSGNWFAQIHRWPDPQISLPPGSELTVKPPAGGGDDNSTSEVKISNRFCTITLTVESVFPVRAVGEYRIMAGFSDEQVSDFANNLFVVRARIEYDRLRSGHPDMKVYKLWARQLVDELRDQFDEQLIWARLKDMDMRSRHYPLEKFTPRGRVPQRTQ
jgi:hypothetical protein